MLYVYVYYHLQAENTARLTGPVLSVAHRQRALQADAQVVNQTFQKVLSLCHIIYNRSCSMSTTDIASRCPSSESDISESALFMS